MHGRLKVRTTEEQAEAKKQEQLQKLKIVTEVKNKVFKKKENEDYDEEGLELTRRMLEENPDISTFWNYRRNTLLFFQKSGNKSNEELKNLALSEMGLTQSSLKANPKSYCAWHHRYWAMKFNPEPDWKRELKLCDFFLSRDERNFHCWDYRRLVCKECGVSPKEELAYTTELIENNFSNYSAWHYRSFLLPIVHPGPVEGSICEEVLLKELNLIQNAAFTDPDDQSVWFYHRWLLGRSKIPLQILNLSILKPQSTIAVLFSEPVKIGDGSMELKINDHPLSLTWKAVGFPSLPPVLWIADISEGLKIKIEESSEVFAELTYRDIKCNFSCFVNGSKSYNWKKTSRADTFRSVLSAATQEVLEQEFQSCEQLNELEPNCKWTLFTSILLMRALNNSKFNSKIAEYMEILKGVDSSRKNYYNDLSSKFVIENTIEALPMSALEVDLSNKSLSCLYHFDQLILIEKINLSCNQLTSVRPLAYLICVKTVVLDDNKLPNLDGLENLKNLEFLSVKKNLISDISALAVLKTCKNLQELVVQDNPISNNLHHSELIKDLLKLKITDCLS